jgi:hypothetical protein
MSKAGAAMTTRATMTAVLAVVLMLAAQPARSDEECDTIVESMDGAVQVASKVTDMEMAEITKTKPETDAQKASIKHRFCSSSGEFLGVSRAYRAVAAECLQGSKRRATLSSLDASIKQLEDSIGKSCR